jgi:leucyl aminopeptidase
MKVEIKKSPLENLNSDALIVFVAQRPEGKNGTPKKVALAKGKEHSAKKDGNKDSKKESRAYVEGVSKALQAKVQAAIDDDSLTGGANEVTLFRDTGFASARHLLLVGLGNPKNLGNESLRQAMAVAINALKGTKAKTAAVALDSLPHTSLGAAVIVQALSEGALLAEYAFVDYKEKKELNTPERLTIISSSKAKGHDHGVETGTTISECVNFCRWLGDRPGNRMTPAMLAEETVKAAKGTKLKVNIWDRARIKDEKMGSFLSVSFGSTQEPKFIVMEYNGAAVGKKPICYVGKGLTFDSGGISIKPSAGMEEMKYDMCGGAAVIATMIAIAKLKLKVNAIAYVPATENMPGPAATKPGDIVIARNGKSIEVNNTDAEGRLILADALIYASEQEPAFIVDAATLTGAMVVALGNIHTGFFTRNNKLAAAIQDAAEASGEWVWRMPLTDLHARDMKGTFADLSNISATKGAGSATAAAFLECFVKKDIPWAHFDVAGTAWHVGDRLPYCARKGASGAMVRTFVQLAMSHA